MDNCKRCGHGPNKHVLTEKHTDEYTVVTYGRCHHVNCQCDNLYVTKDGIVLSQEIPREIDCNEEDVMLV